LFTSELLLYADGFSKEPKTKPDYGGYDNTVKMPCYQHTGAKREMKYSPYSF
jgi:hypothetical protein